MKNSYNIKNDILPENWANALPAETVSIAEELSQRVMLERERGVTVFPPQDELFRALELTPPSSVRVVILGQDPYHGAGQANGLAFSVRSGVRLPPSLRNIFTELQNDLGQPPPPSGELEAWARQGVLLLNASLSVEEGAANSHAAWGWGKLCSAILSYLAEAEQYVIFVLWGSFAQQAAKESGLDLNADSFGTRSYAVIKSAHPSPLSAYRGFLGSKPFSKINALLESKGNAPICWNEK